MTVGIAGAFRSELGHWATRRHGLHNGCYEVLSGRKLGNSGRAIFDVGFWGISELPQARLVTSASSHNRKFANP